MPVKKKKIKIIIKLQCFFYLDHFQKLLFLLSDHFCSFTRKTVHSFFHEERCKNTALFKVNLLEKKIHSDSKYALNRTWGYISLSLDLQKTPVHILESLYMQLEKEIRSHLASDSSMI